MTKVRRIQGWRGVGLRTALLATATLLLVTGTATPAAAATTVSIKSSARIHDFTRPVTISGRLSSHRRGVSLKLYASEFPYAGAVVAGQRKTKKGGYYRFRVTSDLATRYVVTRTSDPSVKSKVLNVYTTYHVYRFKCNLCGRHDEINGPQTLRVSFRAQYPAKAFAAAAAKPQMFYYGQRNGSLRGPSRMQLAQTLAATPVASNVLGVSLSYPVQLPSSGRWSFQFQFCTKDTEALDGLGLPGHHRCGDASITRRQARGYIG